MTIEIIAGSDALSRAIRREDSRWPQRGAGEHRLTPIAKPVLRPGFALVAGEMIFTIGSCFARNIENELAIRGYRIPVREVVASDPSLALVGQSIMNNYAVPAMFNELSWALNEDDAFREESGFYELFPGQFIDINISPKPVSLEECRARRRLITQTYRRITECRVIIMTLGLTEVWFDRSTGRYINLPPHSAMLRRETDRFELHVLDHTETIDYLHRIFSLIQKHCRNDIKIILSVSPVPMILTFRDIDVMEANTYSKAILRSAAEEMRRDFAFVDYYPSFESVTLSDRERAYMADNMHVTRELISINCQRMIDAYSASSTETSEALFRRLDGLDAREIYGLLESRKDAVESDDRLALAFANAALRLNRLEDAEFALSFLPASGAANALKAELLLARGMPGEALDLLTEEPNGRKHATRFLILRLRAELALDDETAARRTATRLHEVNVRTPEPFRILGVHASKAGRVEAADNFFRQALTLAGDSHAVMLDYVEHLHRSGREDEAEKFLQHIDPHNVSQQARMERLRSGLLLID